ncbi:hypothetical protein F4804DRAFT_341582 [Jackrogersella minutella]|nr:hypothetical protein F4804DRAFT_341582 [Jackrogersella minutella]
MDSETMKPDIHLVKRDFEVDVQKRGVLNIFAKEPCVCGLYTYYSQKCGCFYKRVFLKCGKTKSQKTGDSILCAAGRGRKIDVKTAMVPFNCEKCRTCSKRWTGSSNEQQSKTKTTM